MIKQASPIRGLSLLFVGLLFVIPAVSELFPETMTVKNNIDRHGVVFEFSKQVDGIYGGTALAISEQRIQRTDGLLIEELH